MTTTDHKRLHDAVDTIREYELALSWLEKYGSQIQPRSDQVRVSVCIIDAGTCAGAKEAEKSLSAYAKIEMPGIVQTSIVACRNTIEMARSAIMEELSKIGGS